jgi:hypothetical protein
MPWFWRATTSDIGLVLVESIIDRISIPSAAGAATGAATAKAAKERMAATRVNFILTEVWYMNWKRREETERMLKNGNGSPGDKKQKEWRMDLGRIVAWEWVESRD